jgi:hypothetical protein
MSVISLLGKNFVNLPSVLDQYSDDLTGYEESLNLKGKTLETALREQATWSAYYSERAVELNTISKYIDIQVAKTRANLTVKYNENYNPALAATMIDKYINKEAEYLSIAEVGLEVDDLLGKYKSVIEAFKTRGYALRNITEARINEMSQVTL